MTNIVLDTIPINKGISAAFLLPEAIKTIANVEAKSLFLYYNYIMKFSLCQDIGDKFCESK
jgi:hypothetical protein